MAGEKNIDRIDQIHEAVRNTDNLQHARTDNSPAALLTKTDTGTYQLHDLHINGAEDLPGLGINQKYSQNEAFKQTSSDTADGNTTTTYQGRMNDGYVFKTGMSVTETVNDQNQVQRLDVHYNSAQDVVIPGQKDAATGMVSGEARLPSVTDVSIVPLANGESVMRVNSQSSYTGGKFDTLLLDQSGKVIATGDSNAHDGSARDLSQVAATHPEILQKFN